MKPLFKVFLLNRSKEQGFVIPVVIALGLIMTLVGTISIFQSSDEQITATSQRASAKALAAAEIGVARYRELIDNYKIIATYPACDGWRRNGTPNDMSDDTCNNSGSTISWNNITALRDAQPTPQTLINNACPNDGSTEVVDNADSRNWQNVDSSDLDKGQYRLVDYTYTSYYDAGGDANNPSDDVGYSTNPAEQPTGTLTVEGQADGSTVRVQVDLPIQPGIPTRTTNDNSSPLIPRDKIELEDNFNRFNPALWITNGTASPSSVSVSLSGVTVDGNIVVTDTNCTPTSLPTTASLNNNDDSIIVSPQVVSHYTPPGSGVYDISGTPLAGLTLPRNGDTPDANNVFYYNLGNDSISFSGNQGLTIRGGRKVVLFVNGNITLDSNVASGAISLNPQTSNDSSHLEIYGGSMTTSITFRGDNPINIKAFIHAPNATVNINNEPDVNITGAMWVKDWTDSSTNTSDTDDVEITPDDQYFNYRRIEDLMSLGIRLTDPIISEPSRWEVLEAE